MSRWTVTFADGHIETVHALYMQLSEAGAACFFDHSTSADAYAPATLVRCIADGHWVDVSLVPEVST
jgi:hypothetical protein